MATIHAENWFRDFDHLDSDQQKLIKPGILQGNQKVALVNGPAGSGKTLILVNALIKSTSANVAFVSYTRSLLNLADQGLPNNVKGMTYFEAQRHRGTYDLMVIDEVQDIPLEDLNVLLGKASKVIMAGDSFQKIYDKGATDLELTSKANGNAHRLLKSYRLTPKAFAAANKIYPGALEGVSSSGKTMTDIELYYTEQNEEGNKICYDFAKKQAALRKPSAVLLPKRDSIVDFANWVLKTENKPEWRISMTEGRFPTHDFGSLNKHLKAHSIKLQVVQNDFGDLNDALDNHQVIVQTYHSAKGLDYKYVFLPNLAVEDACKFQLQRSLFYVAITRASGALVITQPKWAVSSFVKEIQDFCTVIDPKRITTTDDEF